MSRLRDRLRHLNPAMRDALGVVCAIGAVACLASIIVHWARQYPVHRSPWERQLFGDLAAVEPQGKARAHSKNPLPQPSQRVADDQPILVELSPDRVGTVSASPMADSPISESPVDKRARFIQPVIHEQSANTPTVWLRGDIETDPTEDNNAAEIVFPSQ